ncbi:MAG: dihydroxyacetone kinase subunit L [Alphaproteobacteria bacterium]|nr:MAG: dihydroxyacetone kinase subunit L [Alphaproteobacteria bacterium]
MSAQALMRSLAERMRATIIAHADELTALDQAIGDGDHGINMSRGFNAIGEQTDAIAALPFGEALRKAGMTLVMKVGGASGPLYGSALMEMGKASAAAPASRDELAGMLAAGISAVKARGKSEAGAKTMLDVMIPVHAAIAAGSDLGGVRAAADAALAATRGMRATKGRAAFLGERSVGHLDPGARSTALLIHAVCDVLEANGVAR